MMTHDERPGESRNMKRVTITFSGEFEEHDLAAFVMLLRTINRNNPLRHYEVVINDPDASLDAAKELLLRLMPDLPDRKTTFTVHRGRMT
jgi:hypothetical protein